MLLPQMLSRHRIAAVFVVAIVGIIVAGTLWRQAVNRQTTRIVAEFQHRADQRFQATQEHLAVYPGLMRQLATIGSFDDPVTEPMLVASFERLLSDHPSIAIFEWVPVIEREARADFEQQLSDAHETPLQILARQPDGTLASAPTADYYYPIELVVPQAGNASVLGYDLRSAPTIASLEQALTTRHMVATPQFTLAQQSAPNDLLAINLIMPVYHQGTEPESAELRGFLQCIFRIHESLSGLYRDTANEALLIYYEDASAAADERRVLYANLGGDEPPLTNAQDLALPDQLDGAAPDCYITTLDVGGRQWRFIALLNPTWAAAQRTGTPGLILGGGIFVTLLLSLLVNIILVRDQEIDRLVRQRTRELNTTQRLLEKDITRRIVAEKSWRESQALLQGLLDHSTSEIFVKNSRGRYILSNKQYQLSLEKTAEEIIGKSDHELFEPELADRIVAGDKQILETRQPLRVEFEHVVNGHARVDLIHKFPMFDENDDIHAIAGIITNLNYRVEAEKLRQDYERKLQAGQKMESLGALAGGIAHDFNNILATILGQTSLLQRLNSPTEPQVARIHLIEVAARRAAELCEQMLTYAGRASHESEEVDVNRIITDAIELLTASLPKNIEIKPQLTPDLPPIKINLTQLQQVVMNLAINAADAMAPQAGQVTIRTLHRYYSATELAATVGHTNLPEGDYVTAEVTDTGPGIAPEIIERVFEPFYTTKFQGRGLGLSTVLGIVQNHGGGILVTSSLETGSVFTILFPAIAPAANSPPPPAELPEPSNLSGGVLIVDDEEDLRNIAMNLLEIEGMNTFTAKDGRTALELFREHQNEIDVVLLDLTMPGMSGMETLAALRKLNPELPAIVMSGYSATDPRVDLKEATINAFLQKPFDLNDLLQKVSAALPPR